MSIGYLKVFKTLCSSIYSFIISFINIFSWLPAMTGSVSRDIKIRILLTDMAPLLASQECCFSLPRLKFKTLKSVICFSFILSFAMFFPVPAQLVPWHGIFFPVPSIVLLPFYVIGVPQDRSNDRILMIIIIKQLIVTEYLLRTRHWQLFTECLILTFFFIGYYYNYYIYFIKEKSEFCILNNIRRNFQISLS